MQRNAAYGPLDTPTAEDGDSGFIRLNTRLRPDQLQPREVAGSTNGRMDLEGCWQPRKGIESVSSPIGQNTASIQLLDTPTWKLYDAAAITISSATRSTTTVTVTTSSAHGFSSNTIVLISGLTGTVDPNGNRLITVSSSTVFTFTIAGATGSETYGGSGTTKGAQLSASQANGVFGSCLFSNPASSNDRYIILATNLNAQAIKLSTSAATTIEYPSGVTVTGPVHLVQAFDKVYLFIEGATTLYWNGSFSGTPAFARVSNGAYAAPTYFDAAGNTTVADGLATITAAAHGLAVGDRLYVVERGGTELIESDGQNLYPYEVTEVVSTGSVRINAQVPDIAGASVVYTKLISTGLGLTHMPAPAWGVYHQRRFWVPYAYTMAGSSGASPTITARNVTDELLASDILDPNTYDKISNQFRVTAGIADYLVGVEPFAEDNLLVFNRSSIHLIKGISGSLADTTTELITKEIGCVARRSIVQVGNQVLFLSDNGVYAAAFGDLYNLRGAGVPLSEPINPTVARINRSYAQNAVAAYFNNRYYLAVPLDASTTNNAILIYNFLNQGWESVDTAGVAAWNVTNLIVGDTGGISSLYAVGNMGAVHKLDSRDDAVDRLTVYPGIAAATYAISSSVTTRQYTFGTLERKKFRTHELHIESSASEASDGNVTLEVENPDTTVTLASVSGTLGSALAISEDASVRARIGNKRGYGAQLTFSPTQGRPKLRAVKLQAALTNPAITSTT